MSRKTLEIRKSLESIKALQGQLLKNCGELPEDIARKNQILLEEMQLEIRNVSIWFDMLYKYNGKSRTNSKVTASRENGKKGGRPPKYITDLKNRKTELEALIQQVHAKKLATFDGEEEYALSKEEALYKSELEEIQDKIEKAVLLKNSIIDQPAENS